MGNGRSLSPYSPKLQRDSGRPAVAALSLTFLEGRDAERYRGGGVIQVDAADIATTTSL